MTVNPDEDGVETPSVYLVNWRCLARLLALPPRARRLLRRSGCLLTDRLILEPTPAEAADRSEREAEEDIEVREDDGDQPRTLR